MHNAAMQPPSSTIADSQRDDPGPSDRETPEHLEKRIWRSRMRWTGWLLLVWLCVTFGVSYFARELNSVVGGWPISFWVAAQGALLVYVALVLVFARQMNLLDDERDAQLRR